MLIAIAANENHLKAIVDPHFGRCDWYCLYDTETQQSSFIENTARFHEKNAGCNAADLLIEKGIGLAVAGRFGSKVMEVFRNHNIPIIVPETQQTLNEIITKFK